jgi:hypothetical protein
MADENVPRYAKAELYLNETLAYQAAIAVHHLRQYYGLEVKQLTLVVAPDDPRHPGTVHVTCSLHSVQGDLPVRLEADIDLRKNGDAAS